MKLPALPAWLLSLQLALVVLGQGAGLMHAVSHGAAPARTSASACADAAWHRGAPSLPDPADAAGSCEKCFAFAHLASAAVHSSAPDMPVFVLREATAQAGVALRFAQAPVSRSRGPPTTL